MCVLDSGFAMISISPFDVLGQSFECRSCGRRHVVPVKRVQIGSGVLSQIVTVSQELGLGRGVLVVSDERTWQAAGYDISRSMRQAGLGVDDFVLSDGYRGRVVANEKVVASVHARSENVEWLVAVGTGTISDVVKQVGEQRGLPHISVFTAASINGIASDRAVIEINGVKKSFPVQPPVAVLCDTDVLAKAPISMNLDGFADMLSFPVSLSDWKLDHILNDSYYCALPEGIAKSLGACCLEKSTGIQRGKISSLSSLMAALVGMGLGVTITASSAPVSGAEHLMSYLWDLKREQNGMALNPHGAQVGLATIMCARLYELILQTNPGNVPRAVGEGQAQAINEACVVLRERFGSHGDDMFNSSKETLKRLSSTRDRKDQFIANWQRLQELRNTLLPTWQIVKFLRDAGAHISLKELSITKEAVVEALLYGRFVRERYTILDLAAELGCLNEDVAYNIIDELL